MQLSIIIVDYKTSERSAALARSLSSPDVEVIIVDNTTLNRGYGGGINKGVSQSRGEFLLLLNPDVEITRQQINTMLKYMAQHADVAAVGPQFVDSKNGLVPSSLGRLQAHRAWIDLSLLNRLFPGDKDGWWLRFWDRKSIRDVHAINGACMLVRRIDFEAVGGFDESYFLYWEENDFCQRCIDHGKRVVFFSEVCVTHIQELSMRQSELNLAAYFMQSESRFLRRRLGCVTGTLTSLWIWCTQEWRGIGILLMAFALRTRDLSALPMIDDVRRDYSQALALLHGKGLPLLGIPSSVPRFSQGPLNIWFDALAFKIGGVSFISPVIAASIIASITGFVMYRLLKNRTGKNIAATAALVFTLSPAAITQARLPFYLFAIPLFVLFFLMALERMQSKRRLSVFYALLCFCLLFQWELATIPFIAVFVYALFRNRIRLLTVWKEIFAALVLGLLPQLLFDLTHRCAQLCQFVVWMGYRTVAVSGIDGRHGLTVFTSEFWMSVMQQMQRIVGGGNIGLPVLMIVIVLGVLHRVRTKRLPSLYVYTWISFVCLFLGLVIHGIPSEAYFPPFLVLLPILAAYSLSSFL